MFSVRSLRKLAVLLFLAFPLHGSLASEVRLQTTLGAVDIHLYDDAAPLTVANFLAYVNSGAYNSSFFHRSVPGFIVQGGGYSWPAGGALAKIPSGQTVRNEFSVSRSNVRGTIAMAKRGGDPDSATNEWFVNLADNSANLNNQNGGFTVFGMVSDKGMAVIDALASLPIVNGGGAFTDLPIVGLPAAGSTLKPENLAMVSSVFVLPADAQSSDRVFDYLETTYPQYLAPAGAVSTTMAGYYFRYYAGTRSYIGTANGMVYYLVPAIGDAVAPLGTLADWLGIAANASF